MLALFTPINFPYCIALKKTYYTSASPVDGPGRPIPHGGGQGPLCVVPRVVVGVLVVSVVLGVVSQFLIRLEIRVVFVGAANGKRK